MLLANRITKSIKILVNPLHGNKIDAVGMISRKGIGNWMVCGLDSGHWNRVVYRFADTRLTK